MRVLVAGASGVVGRALVPMLVEAGHEVVGMTRSQDGAAAAARAGAEPLVADALDREAVVAAVAGARPDAVVHQLTSIPAALEPRRFERQFAATNELRRAGTRNLLEGAAEAGATRFVAQSNAFGYAPEGGPVKDEDAPLWPDPPAAYAPTVRAAEDLERQVTAAGGTVLRYGHLYGAGTGYGPGGHIEQMVRSRRFPVVGDGGAVFSFVTVEDAARTALLALERDVRGILNVVDDDPAPVRDWLPAYAEALGAKPPRRVPAWIARRVAGEFGVLWLTELRGASNERARRELGWSPSPPSWRERLGHQT